MRTLTPIRSLAAGLALSLVLAACSGATGGTASPTGESDTSPSGDATGGTPAPLVDESLIVSGGPPPDGIPPIDDPAFVAPKDALFLEDREPVLAVEIDGDARAYPLQILTWHEIVNDEVGDVPVSVTYCPLCNTGVAFERPVIGGELLDFGTSGRLYNSNLVMYDRQTGSYWAQATGQAIVGELTGEQLVFVPARILSFGDWRAEHPDGLVLSDETGYERSYGENPYAGYDESENPFLFIGEPDGRLPAIARVLGVAGDGDTLAFPYDEVREGAVDGWATASARVGSQDVVVFWKAGTASALDTPTIAEGRDVGAMAAFDPELDGRSLTFSVTPEGIVDDQTGSVWNVSGRAVAGNLEGERLEVMVAIDSFWFDWAAFHPETRIYRAA